VNRIRVLLADDHRMIAEGLKRLLAAEFDVVGLVEDGRALVEAAARLRPDVIVSDITMPGLNGLEAIGLLKRHDPSVRVVVITMHRETAYARRALQAGASGFVLKSSAPGELTDAIRAAMAGRTFVTPEIAGEVSPASERARRPPGAATGSLTPRQREILQLLAAGKTAKEIAAVLSVSARTVEFHKYKMMEAVGVRTGAELVRFAVEHGIATP
jgi:DNA-binding NarL/FixJ family response regulator